MEIIQQFKILNIKEWIKFECWYGYQILNSVHCFDIHIGHMKNAGTDNIPCPFEGGEIKVMDAI